MGGGGEQFYFLRTLQYGTNYYFQGSAVTLENITGPLVSHNHLADNISQNEGGSEDVLGALITQEHILRFIPH